MTPLHNLRGMDQRGPALADPSVRTHPHACPAVEPLVAAALRPEQPETTERVMPEARVEAPPTHGRDHDEHRLSPRVAVVLAGHQDDMVAGTFPVASCVPCGPETTRPRAFDGRDPLPLPRGRLKLRSRALDDTGDFCVHRVLQVPAFRHCSVPNA
jgi:hypothetical protein